MRQRAFASELAELVEGGKGALKEGVCSSEDETEPSPEDVRNPHSTPSQWPPRLVCRGRQDPKRLVSGSVFMATLALATSLPCFPELFTPTLQSCLLWLPPTFPSSGTAAAACSPCMCPIFSLGSKVHRLEGKTPGESIQRQGNVVLMCHFRHRIRELELEEILKVCQFQDEESEVQKGRLTCLPSCT